MSESSSNDLVVTPYFKLVNCDNLTADILVANDLSLSLGKFVKLKDNNCCWEVQSYTTDDIVTEEVIVQFEYYSCEHCLGQPIFKLIKPIRDVAPGYKYVLVDSDYVDKTMCEFVEVMFKQMKSEIFSINICSEKSDKKILNHEILNLKLISDDTKNLKNSPSNCCKTMQFILNFNNGNQGVINGVDCLGNDVSIVLEECNVMAELCLDTAFEVEIIGDIEVVTKNDCRL